MKKVGVILACLLVLVPSLVFSAGETEATAGTSGPVELKMMHPWGGANGEYLADVAKAFEAKNPDIKINIVAKPGGYVPLLQAMIADLAAGNEPPDMFVCGYNLLNYVALELQPTEVKDLAPSAAAYEDLKSRFEAPVFAISNVNGKQVGMPFAFSNMISYVNMDIFRAAGLTEADVPTTWEDVLRVGKIIKERTGKYAIGIQLPDTWADVTLIYSAGGTIKNADNTKVDLTNPGAIEALTMWQKFYKAGITPCETSAELEADFTAGNIAMHCTTIMKINGYRSHATFELKAAKMPTFGTRRNKLATGGSAIISLSKDKAKKDAVWKFLDFVASKEGMELFTKTGYLCPTKDEVPKSEYQLVAYEQKPLAIMWENWPGGAVGLEIERLYINARNAILLQDAPVEETLRKTEAECNKLL